MGLGSTEKGAEGGAVKGSLSQAKSTEIHSEDISLVSRSSFETEVLGGTLSRQKKWWMS